MKVWVKHWVSLHTRPVTRKAESPVLLVSIEQGSLGEGQLPVMAKPVLRHYMSNVFIYLMPADQDDNVSKGLIHNWELKLGMPVEEAKQFAENLLKAIELCEKRRQERHKEHAREEDISRNDFLAAEKEKVKCPRCGNSITPKIAQPRMASPFPNRKKPYCPRCGVYLPDSFKQYVKR